MTAPVPAVPGESEERRAHDLIPAPGGDGFRHSPTCWCADPDALRADNEGLYRVIEDVTEQRDRLAAALGRVETVVEQMEQSTGAVWLVAPILRAALSDAAGSL